MMKLFKTRKDLSVWIIACIWLAINTIGILIWGKDALIFTNLIVLFFLTIFVFWVKKTPKIDNWFETKIW